MKLPIFELFIKEEDDILGLALVNRPAIEENFIYFNEEEIKMVFNDEQMIIKGAALIPQKLIYRNDEFGERYVFFSQETIQRFAELLILKKNNKFNAGHSDEFINANIIESYFAQEPNEFNVPSGSWIVSLHIKDVTIWNKIKNGLLNGFSIQGLFSNEIIQFETNKQINKNMDLKEKLLKAINSVLFSDEPIVEPVVEPVEPVEPIVEPVVEPVEPIVEPVEQVEPIVEPIVVPEEKIDIAEYKETISTLKDNLKVLTDELSSLKGKLEEYGKQPLASTVTEEVATNIVTNKKVNKATEFFQNK